MIESFQHTRKVGQILNKERRRFDWMVTRSTKQNQQGLHNKSEKEKHMHKLGREALIFCFKKIIENRTSLVHGSINKKMRTR